MRAYRGSGGGLLGEGLASSLARAPLSALPTVPHRHSYGLTPWSRNSIAARPRSLSSHGAAPPIVVQRSFVLPVSVRSIAFSRTKGGVTPSPLLLTTVNDGACAREVPPTMCADANATLVPPSPPHPRHHPTDILSLDRRLVDPRRPTGEPRESDKAEGLGQYTPLLPLRHTWLLNHGTPVPRLASLLPTPTAWESTALVIGLGLDTFVARIAPARRFDQLDPEFNAGLFVVLMGGAAVATIVLGKLAANKELKEAWA